MFRKALSINTSGASRDILAALWKAVVEVRRPTFRQTIMSVWRQQIRIHRVAAGWRRRREPVWFCHSSRAGEIALGPWRLSQKDVALSHENEKDQVGNTKQRHEDQMRHVSDERIIKNGGAVRQLVKHRADASK